MDVLPKLLRNLAFVLATAVASGHALAGSPSPEAIREAIDKRVLRDASRTKASLPATLTLADGTALRLTYYRPGAGDLLVAVARAVTSATSDPSHTLWWRREGGQWKAGGSLAIEHRMVSAPPPQTAMAITSETSGDAQPIRIAEAEFGSVCGSGGMALAYKALAADDLAVLRAGAALLRGKTSAIAFEETLGERWMYIAHKTHVSRGNDFAVVSGTYSKRNAANVLSSGRFLRVWAKRGGDWRVVLDVAGP